MSEAKHPALYRAASAASQATQRRFMNLIKAHFILLGFVAVMTGVAGLPGPTQRAVAVIVIILTLLALGVSWGTRMGRFDDRWFAARAVAENVKSAMWRYIALPSESKTEDDRRYLRTLEEIRQRVPESQARLAEFRFDGSEITEWMVESRSAPLADRVRQFREERLQDQKRWYASRARMNASMERRLWGLIVCAEIAGVLSAVAQAWLMGWFNPVGGIAAVSAGLIGWAQTKRHSDLATSYAIASEDLARLDSHVGPGLTEIDFQCLVRDVENAISREHGFWVSYHPP